MTLAQAIIQKNRQNRQKQTNKQQKSINQQTNNLTTLTLITINDDYHFNNYDKNKINYFIYTNTHSQLEFNII